MELTGVCKVHEGDAERVGRGFGVGADGMKGEWDSARRRFSRCEGVSGVDGFPVNIELEEDVIEMGLRLLGKKSRPVRAPPRQVRARGRYSRRSR